MSFLAIDIGGTKFALALFDSSGRMLKRESRTTDRDGGPRWMTARFPEIVQSWDARDPIEAVGIGFGGPVDFATQSVVLSTHVGGWEGFNLVDQVRETFGAPVLMDNDANVGGLGEGLHGAGKGYRPLFYMTLSTGIGGGILTSEGVYRGADSYAGEIGHLTIRPDGPDCLCGANGCFERMCCGLWLERDYGKPVVELLGDSAFVRDYVVNLSLGLKSAIMLLNPARIVIGGGIAKSGDKLFVPLREELGRRITSWSHARVDVVPASLGDDSVLYGAYELAVQAAGQSKGKSI